MRTLLRRYPDFPDMRAALAAAQWAAGREGDAETNWQRVEDPRWVRQMESYRQNVAAGLCQWGCEHVSCMSLIIWWLGDVLVVHLTRGKLEALSVI